MYQITGETVSFRVNPEEKQALNDIALTLQTSLNQVFTNSKQLVIALLTHCNQLQTQLNTNVDNLNTELNTDVNILNSPEFEQALFERTKELSDECNLLAEAKAKLEVECNLQTTEIQALKETLAVYDDMDIETVEVDKPFVPGPNDVYLPLDDQRANTLRTIAANRAKRKKLDTPESISTIASQMIFNRASLFDWGGEYWTGLKKL